MDEMEALCNRIAILSAGELAALGSPAMLRAHHASGHDLAFKITSLSVENKKDTEVAIEELKQTIKKTFNCELKDEHQTMLKYHVKETMSYSKLFDALEFIKGKFPRLIQDYSVTGTTLEQVFLSFAQRKKDKIHAVVAAKKAATKWKAAAKKAAANKADANAKGADHKKADAKRADAKKAHAKKADAKGADDKKADAKKTDAKKTDAKKAHAKKADAKGADDKKADAKKTDAKKTDAKKGDFGKLPPLEKRK